MICLGDSDKGLPIDETTYSKLLKLLTLITSYKVPVRQKLTILEEEYHIATTRKLEEEFNTMCNWSEGIIERIRKDVINEVTDEVTQKSNERAIINVMQSFNISFEKACESLQLDPSDYSSLKERMPDTTSL